MGEDTTYRGIIGNHPLAYKANKWTVRGKERRILGEVSGSKMFCEKC